MAAAIDLGATPQMLCKPQPDQNICLTSKREGSPTGEVAIFYDQSSGIVDHIAITSYQHGTNHGADAAQFIGVIRNYTGNGGHLRCFSLYYNSSQTCTAPPDSFFVPEGVPYTMSDVPIVSWNTVESASNADGWSPKEPIPGAKITTTGGTNDYDSFGVENMTSTCQQSAAYQGPSSSEVLVAYVKNVPFGPASLGVGTRDALVIDTFAGGSPPHAERYFYVQGLGRVVEGSATYNYSTHQYTVDPDHVDHDYLRALTSDILIDKDNPEPRCPQGSAIALWGYH